MFTDESPEQGSEMLDLVARELISPRRDPQRCGLVAARQAKPGEAHPALQHEAPIGRTGVRRGTAGMPTLPTPVLSERSGHDRGRRRQVTLADRR